MFCIYNNFGYDTEHEFTVPGKKVYQASENFVFPQSKIFYATIPSISAKWSYLSLNIGLAVTFSPSTSKWSKIYIPRIFEVQKIPVPSSTREDNLTYLANPSLWCKINISQSKIPIPPPHFLEIPVILSMNGNS